MTKDEIKRKEEKLLELTRTMCAEKLDGDYRQLCEKLILKMGRKREVPFKRGRLDIWAAAVVYTIGSINFLFDSSFEPHMTADEVSDYFGTKKSTVSNKAGQIKDMFDLGYFNPEFSTPDMNKQNPFNNYVMVDGFVVPVSELPVDLQILVKETRANGQDIEFTTDSE